MTREYKYLGEKPKTEVLASTKAGGGRNVGKVCEKGEGDLFRKISSVLKLVLEWGHRPGVLNNWRGMPFSGDIILEKI